jgi:hypothetical protein
MSADIVPSPNTAHQRKMARMQAEVEELSRLCDHLRDLIRYAWAQERPEHAFRSL